MLLWADGLLLYEPGLPNKRVEPTALRGCG